MRGDKSVSLPQHYQLTTLVRPLATPASNYGAKKWREEGWAGREGDREGDTERKERRMKRKERKMKQRGRR